MLSFQVKFVQTDRQTDNVKQYLLILGHENAVKFKLSIFKLSYLKV